MTRTRWAAFDVVASAATVLAACHTPDSGGPAAAQALVASRSPTDAPGPPGTLRARGGPVPRILLTPEVRQALLRRAGAGSPGFRALRATCDRYIGGGVEWPDGRDYPDPPSVGEGYQGDGYFPTLLDLALCHQLALDGAPGGERGYGAKAAEILDRMSAIDGPHAVDPLRDSGYGIRFFGVGMAIGYDWVGDVLRPEQKAALRRALDRWIRTYEGRGFGREHPQGNYFAGYYAAKAMAALAVDGDDPLGDTWWVDWRERVHGAMVEPYYAKYLAGGGWPEGWHYGVVGTFNMVLPAVAVGLARGDRLEGYRFPDDQGQDMVHFTWPDRATLDDRGAQKVGNHPSAALPWIYTVLAGMLETRHAPFAPSLHRFAREVRAVPGAAAVEPWEEMLFWDEQAPEDDVAKLPRSYVAQGMQTVAMRSSWERSAVWGSFTSGTYVNYPGSGEMTFDQGSLVIVRGGQAVLGNAAPMLLRHSPGTSDGEGRDEQVYDEDFGNNDANPRAGNRSNYNVFYALTRHFGQIARTAEEGARTRLGFAEDRGSFVAMRGDHLEDMVRPDPAGGRPAVVGWTRQVVYVRPGTFVVDDRTEVASAKMDQWTAFHFCARPAPASAVAGDRMLVSCGPSAAAAVSVLSPRDAKTKVVDLFDAHKVFRLETHPAQEGAAQRWLHAIEVGAKATELGVARRLSPADGNVATPGALGSAVDRASSSDVVIAAPLAAGAELRYTVRDRDGLHVVTDLAPSGRYAVTVARQDGALAVVVAPGDGFVASPAGIVAFRMAGGAPRAP